MLFILKQLLLHTPDSAITNFDEKLFSLLLLQANDLMHSEELIPEDTAGKLLHIAMQMYGVQENAIGIRASRITRSYTMTSSAFDSAQNKAASFDVPNMFEKACGITLSTYQALIVACLTRFSPAAAPKLPDTLSNYFIPVDYFSSTKVPQDLIATFFDNVSATPEQYLAGQSLDRGAGDFTSLRDTPLLALPDGFYPLDITFLVDKFESSPFWNIARSLEEQTKKRFFSFWGGLFETYVRNIIVESVDGRLNRVIPFSIFEDNGEEFCDLAIICGRALIVIEIKGTTLTAAAKYSGSLKALKEEIDKKFVESADRTQATKQLSRNILQAFNIPGRKVAGMPSDIVQVFPVIVTLDEIGGTVGVNAYLGDYF